MAIVESAFQRVTQFYEGIDAGSNRVVKATKRTAACAAFAFLGMGSLIAKIYNIAVAKLNDVAAKFGPQKLVAYYQANATAYRLAAAEDSLLAGRCFTAARDAFPFRRSAAPVVS